MLEQESRIRQFRRTGWTLCVLWTLGLILGAAAAQTCAEIWCQTLTQAARCCVSLSGALSTAVLPLVVTMAAIGIFGSRSCWAVCALWALQTGLSCAAAGRVWAAGAPAAVGLVLWTTLLSAPLLLVFWWRRLCVGPQSLGREAGILLAAQLLIGAGNYRLISPLLAEILAH